MLLKEPFHQIRFVRGEVVEDDVNLLLGGLLGDDFFQKSNKLLAGVACGRLANDLAGLRIQGRVQRERPVPVILEPCFSARPGDNGKRRSSRSSA
jgi:hypothetical protein